MSDHELIVFQIAKPTQKHKKYKAEVFWDGRRRWIHFGDNRYDQYKDSTGLGLWSHLDHNNKQRRELYHKRHHFNNGVASQLSKMYLW